MREVHAELACQNSRDRARVGWEVNIGVTIHDMMSNLRQKGVDSLGQSAAKKALMAQNWGEQLNLNSKRTIKLQGLTTRQHLFILDLSS